ncbi:hypothetical protein NADFUDRAFT_47659 [Nadsonia fulvescens var. elongata DSM 6958]|uniref:Pyruvate decarboxylase n=1 Tax=Nadsonia fulvescens var. elongata DSM 6958 TaxID=857566 RepID=A0A1E3PF60_9ASCO|nr:hypothetical protein NADFUDRAFT_47659 [Nadsonia fulvescens var. elongata DSM 6958]
MDPTLISFVAYSPTSDLQDLNMTTDQLISAADANDSDNIPDVVSSATVTTANGIPNGIALDLNDPSPHLGTYLFSRIAQLGIQHIMGVPGDYNLNLLDYIFTIPNLNWIGCCNELNAAYAADGYGRVRNLPGVLITTYGVGELSALNGVSGAFAESSPMLHIVGVPGRPLEQNNMLIHHCLPQVNSFNPPQLTVYQDLSKPVRCDMAYLDNPLTAAADIDRVIENIVKNSLPGYLYIPVDMVWLPIDGSRLKVPLDLENKNTVATASPAVMGIPQPAITEFNGDIDRELAKIILRLIIAAKQPAILADTLAERHRAADDVKQLVELTQFWAFSTVLGKGIVDETSPQYVGCFNGAGSLTGIAEFFASADLVLHIGPLLSDSNTGGWTLNIAEKHCILLHPNYISILGKVYHGVHFKPVLKALNRLLSLDANLRNSLPRPIAKPVVCPPPELPSPADISQSYFVRVMNSFFRPHDLILAETGTFQFSVPDLAFARGMSLITQIFYSCIGFTLPATLGACLARKETNSPGRVILVEGDGSAQMTIQELGTIVRFGLHPIIFLLNNDGYSIERAIHGEDATYNDICPRWKWTQLLSVFGGDNGKNVFSATVSTRVELENLLESEEISNGGKTVLIEVMMDVKDYPWRLVEGLKGVKARNAELFKAYAKRQQNQIELC